ncbi:MAG: RsmE family RNA methyltransferase [Eubacteriaceae bacterium]
MHRFFLEQPLQQDCERIFLSGDENRHLTSVLRLGPGEDVILTDPAGLVCEARIIHTGNDATELEPVAFLPPETENKTAEITLFQGIPKGSKQEMIVQKGTELGISAFVPFYSKRSVVRPSGSDEKKRTRLQRIAREASKQSGRVFVPEVSAFVSFSDLEEALAPFDLVLLAYENEDNIRLKELLRSVEREQHLKIAVIVGPEGGFDEGEVVRLEEWGAQRFTFGKRILRTETAGLAAAAQINYEFDEG